VLIPEREFPANVYPWLMQRSRGVNVEFVPATSDGWPDEDRIIARLADPKVKALSISWVQFSNGYRADLDRLSAACRENDAFFVVDAIQGVGQIPIDVRKTQIDVLACGGQKWLLSPWGSGFVYVRKEIQPLLEPVVVGWMSFEGTDDFTKLTEYNAALRDNARR
ncbi:MAG: aminotransferase class V-fold PLP-dependent enzyme, partial [Gemmatimonadetes bacterium]|nr:aminotransferase class V-fold PLP-dependent enzyme [Gemmatimonadota bacterium]